MKTKTKAIGIVLGIIVLWMFVVGGSLFKYFDEIVERNQLLTAQKWTYVCQKERPFTDIKPVNGGDLFIANDKIWYYLIDENGKEVAGPFDELDQLGGGYVKTSYTPSGIVRTDENGNNIRTETHVLGMDGKVLSDEKAAPLMERYEQEGKLTGETQKGQINYKVMQKGKILGIVEIGE